MVIALSLVALAFLCFFPTFRCALLNLPLVIYHGAIDLWTYFKHKEFNLYFTGELIAYTGLFGKGKTLSAVHRVVGAYRNFDGKIVWCPRRKKFVTQRIKILSNVALNVPYEALTSLEQVVAEGQRKQEIDDQNDTLTITLVLGDEFSVQMNSRNFKTNIDPLFLNTILTCRHYYISLYYTAQRFHHVDALLRQVTSCVIECNKLWRFQRLAKYDAWDLENAVNAQMVQPLARMCWFVWNRDYEAYNTLACVGNLAHDVQGGHMMSEEEIMRMRQGTQQGSMDTVSRPSGRWKRMHKSGRK